MAVRNTPWVSRRMRRPKMISTLAGGPGEGGFAARGGGGVDEILDPHRPAVFEVLLDRRVLEEQVEHPPAGVGPDRWAVDGSAEHALGVAADAAAEDDLDVGGAADVE